LKRRGGKNGEKKRVFLVVELCLFLALTNNHGGIQTSTDEYHDLGFNFCTGLIHQASAAIRILLKKKKYIYKSTICILCILLCINPTKFYVMYMFYFKETPKLSARLQLWGRRLGQHQRGGCGVAKPELGLFDLPPAWPHGWTGLLPAAVGGGGGRLQGEVSMQQP